MSLRNGPATYWIKYSIIGTKAKQKRGKNFLGCQDCCQYLPYVLATPCAQPLSPPPPRPSSRLPSGRSDILWQRRQLNLIDNFECVINIYRSTWASFRSLAYPVPRIHYIHIRTYILSIKLTATHMAATELSCIRHCLLLADEVPKWVEILRAGTRVGQDWRCGCGGWRYVVASTSASLLSSSGN